MLMRANIRPYVFITNLVAENRNANIFYVCEYIKIIEKRRQRFGEDNPVLTSADLNKPAGHFHC
jgi:hypothetical protein